MKKLLSLLTVALLTTGSVWADALKTRYYIYTNSEMPTIVNTTNVTDYRYTDGTGNIAFFTNENAHSDGTVDWTTPQVEIDASETSALKVKCLGGDDEGTNTWVFGFQNSSATTFDKMHGGWKFHIRMTTNSENAIEIRLGENAENVGNTAKYTISSDVSRRGTAGKQIEIDGKMSEFFSFDPANFQEISGAYFAIAGSGIKDGDDNDVFLTLEEFYVERTYGDDYTVETPETWNFDNDYGTLTINADLTIEAGHTITADNVVVPVAADGTAPQITVESGAQLVVNQNYIVKRSVLANQWALVTLPSAFNFSSDVTASWGTTLTKKAHTPISHHGYENDVDNIWNTGVWGDRVYPARDGKRDYANGNNVSFAVAFKADRDDVVTITGGSTMIEGKDYSLSNLWETAWAYNENFNLIGQPFTSNYTGKFKSPNATARPNAQKGIVTYQYDAANDVYIPNLVMDAAATFKPYEAFFTQNYENLAAPFTPIATTGETYNVTAQFGLSLSNDKVRFVEMTGATEAFAQNIDAMKLFGFDTNTPAIYTFKDGEWKMSASVVPSFADKAYRIGIRIPAAGEYGLTATDVEADYRLIVTDAVTGTTTVLKNNETYTFSVAAEAAGFINDRFTVEYAPKLQKTNASQTQLTLTGAFRTDDFNAIEKDLATMTSADMTQVKAITLEGLTNVKAAVNPNCLYYLSNSVTESVKPIANVVINDNENYTAQEILLTDKKDFCNLHAFTAAKATYNRTFTEDKKETLYLPFTPEAGKGKYYAYSETVEVDGEDVPVARFTSTDNPAANTPYLFIANASAAESGKMEATNTTFPVTPEQAESGFIGILTRQAVPDGAFGFQNDKFNVVQSADAANPVMISAFRAYLKEPAAAGEAKMLKVAFVEAMPEEQPTTEPTIDEPQEVTAIAPMSIAEDTPVSVYSLDGHLLRRAVGRREALAGLAKGIYIVSEGNGRSKKIVK